ncbi:MAG TPA: DoxX family protein [Polyangiaceae bacterium]|nr:DoxX family protein [Polyangiaceae bacterium]
MTSDVLPASQRPPSSRRHVNTPALGASSAARLLVPVGRFLFALIFLVSTPLHFQHAGVAYAAQAGTPLAGLLVPLAGLLALFGGLSVLFGYHARVGALLLAIFLVPVTLIMHAFWATPDAGTALLERVMFMKNLAMFGAALLLMYFGAGPISIDERQGRT